MSTTKHYTTGKDLSLANPGIFICVEYDFYVSEQSDLFDKSKGKIEIDVVNFGVMQTTETFYYTDAKSRNIALQEVEMVKRSFTTLPLTIVR